MKPRLTLMAAAAEHAADALPAEDDLRAAILAYEQGRHAEAERRLVAAARAGSAAARDLLERYSGTHLFRRM